MQIQPLTWQAFLLQLLLSLGPAVIALAVAYITLRHQRKLKADELKASSTLRARELVFGIYEKKLADLLLRSAALGETAAKFKIQILSGMNDDKTTLESAASFFSVVYSQAFQMPDTTEEMEAELSAIGLKEKFADNLIFIKNSTLTGFQTIPPSAPQAVMENVVENMLKATAFMVNMQRAIVEAKATELFQDYLPTTDRRLAQKKGKD